MKNMRKKSVAVLAGLAVAGIVGASAASLGGVTANDLGADVGVVASCDTDGVIVDFTTGFSGGVPTVTSVTVSGINANCAGQNIDVTLLNSTNTQLGSIGTAVVGGASVSVGGFGSPDAEAVTGVAIVISE